MLYLMLIARRPSPGPLSRIRNFCVHVDGDVSSQRKDLKVGERRRARNCLRMVCVVNALMPVLATPVYSLVYNATVGVFPGTVFVLLAALCAVICCLAVWLYTRFDQQTAATSRAQATEWHVGSRGPGPRWRRRDYAAGLRVIRAASRRLCCRTTTLAVSFGGPSANLFLPFS
ncbi:hypothetical protein C7M84_010748 [Penaeus vannamei]|uniref:Uncharacterized protein n=1 Tax=Penaeus vannamei TaxID=6689 RepID=A0A423T3A5_PENVA|nr:hypothetical protein C7M84_010748 [Penaeus vannamei]